MAADRIPIYIAFGADGKARPWTIRPTRTATMEAATETMMGFHDYELLMDRSTRWRFLYSEGCRIRKSMLVMEIEQ